MFYFALSDVKQQCTLRRNNFCEARTAKNKEEAFELLKAFGMPFKDK